MTIKAVNSNSKNQNLVDKKVFLIACENPEKTKRLREAIEKQLDKTTIYTANDGSLALTKAINAPPHVIITDVHLPKLSGLHLADKVLESHETQKTAVILCGHPPAEEKHLDEIVTARLQYLVNDEEEKEFNFCLVKALNYSAHNTKADFYIRFLAKDEVLIREGDRADYVYFVKRGQLRAYKELTPDQKLHLGFIECGEFVGEMAYLNGQPRSAHVAAVTDCELIEVPIGHFEKVLYKRPSWSKALMLTLSKRVRVANQLPKR
jgi:CRP/FNR family cyclic AMP-dependent transcriptional regulator